MTADADGEGDHNGTNGVPDDLGTSNGGIETEDGYVARW